MAAAAVRRNRPTATPQQPEHKQVMADLGAGPVVLKRAVAKALHPRERVVDRVVDACHHNNNKPDLPDSDQYTRSGCPPAFRAKQDNRNTAALATKPSNRAYSTQQGNAATDTPNRRDNKIGATDSIQGEFEQTHRNRRTARRQIRAGSRDPQRRRPGSSGTRPEKRSEAKGRVRL
jgi:hypothetical protein